MSKVNEEQPSDIPSGKVEKDNSVSDAALFAVLRNALETEGSQVVFNSEKGLVVYCPVSSRCKGTSDHCSDCWIGQAMRLIPTCDTKSSKSTSLPTAEVDKATPRERAEKVVREWSSLFMGKVVGEATYADLVNRLAIEFAASPDALPVESQDEQNDQG